MGSQRAWGDSVRAIHHSENSVSEAGTKIRLEVSQSIWKIVPDRENHMLGSTEV